MAQQIDGFIVNFTSIIFLVQGYAYGKYLGWFIVTTGLITALPLIFEVVSTFQHILMFS